MDSFRNRINTCIIVMVPDRGRLSVIALMQSLYQLAVLTQQLGQDYLPIDLSDELGRPATDLHQLIKESSKPPDSARAAKHLGITDKPEYLLRVMEYLEMALLNGLAAVSVARGGNKSAAQAKRYVWKLIAIAKRQSLVADSELVIPYLKEAFRLAEYHAFTDAARVAIELLALLRANRYYHKREYLKSREKAAYYRELCRRLRQIKSGINHLELLERDQPTKRVRQLSVLTLRSEMAPLRRATDNLRFNLVYFAFEIKCFLLQEDYRGAITKAHEAIQYCQEQPARFWGSSAPFVASLSIGLLQTDQPVEALGYAKDLLKVQEKGSLQYSKTVELIILLSFRARRYQQAADYFSLLQRDLRTERWTTYPLFAAYLLLLGKAGEVELPEGMQHGSRGKVAGYLAVLREGDAPVEQTVHYQVISFYLELVAGKYADCRSWVQTLKAQAANLKHLRMKYLLMALIVIPEQAFHRVAVERHAAKSLKKLDNTPPSSQPVEEIIPLPELWRLLVNQLGTRRISARTSGTKTS